MKRPLAVEHGFRQIIEGTRLPGPNEVSSWAYRERRGKVSMLCDHNTGHKENAHLLSGRPIQRRCCSYCGTPMSRWYDPYAPQDIEDLRNYDPEAPSQWHNANKQQRAGWNTSSRQSGATWYSPNADILGDIQEMHRRMNNA